MVKKFSFQLEIISLEKGLFHSFKIQNTDIDKSHSQSFSLLSGTSTDLYLLNTMKVVVMGMIISNHLTLTRIRAAVLSKYQLKTTCSSLPLHQGLQNRSLHYR